jgi:hypothetical protein
MSYGYKDRFYATSGSHDCPDGIPFVKKQAGTASLLSRLLIFPHEPAFCTSDGRNMNEHTDVAGDPEPTGMRYPLPIKNEEIRFLLEPVQRIHDGRSLPETQQTGHVRKINPTPGSHMFNSLQMGV